MVPADTLRGRGIFAAVPDGRLDRFAALGEPIDLLKGEFLFRLGDRARWLYLIDSGKLDLSIPLKMLGEFNELTIQTSVAGDTVAWSALVKPHLLTMSARAVEDCQLIRFEGEALGVQVREDSGVGLAVMDRLAELIGRRLQQVQAMWIREIQRSIDRRLV